LSSSPLTLINRSWLTSANIPHKVGWQFIGHIVRTTFEVLVVIECTVAGGACPDGVRGQYRSVPPDSQLEPSRPSKDRLRPRPEAPAPGRVLIWRSLTGGFGSKLVAEAPAISDRVIDSRPLPTPRPPLERRAGRRRTGDRRIGLPASIGNAWDSLWSVSSSAAGRCTREFACRLGLASRLFFGATVSGPIRENHRRTSIRKAPRAAPHGERHPEKKKPAPIGAG
jgi:hypothetical protein